jgi:hypothetical protein
MTAFLVTGNPGSGKSTLAQLLARRGLATVDPDYDPELSYWEDHAGNRLSGHDGPAAPDEQWLRHTAVGVDGVYMALGAWAGGAGANH